VKRFCFLTLALMILFVCGCRSVPSQTRVYPEPFDNVWTAAVATVDKMTHQPPASADKAKGKIVSEVFFGDVTESATSTDGYGQTTLSPRKEVETWVVSVAVSGSGASSVVKVTARKGGLGNNQPFDGSLRQQPSVSVTLASNDTTWPAKFLDELATELAKQNSRKGLP
jgi:hypothetical protein